VPLIHLVSRNRRDEQQTIIYSNTVVNEQQKIQLLKAEEIASMLGLKVQTIYTMARRGELEKLSRRCVRFRAGDVARFIEKKRLVKS